MSARRPGGPEEGPRDPGGPLDPEGPRDPGGPSVDEHFCCPGCQNVYAILLESGLVREGVDLRETELFRRSRELGLVSSGPAALPPAAAPAGRPGQEISFRVGGMWCASCAWLIEHALGKEPGVTEAGVSFASDVAVVRYDPMVASPGRIRARVDSLGYRSLDGDDGEAARRAERRDALLRLGISAFLWLNVMMLNMAVYVGYFESLPSFIATRLPLVLMVLSAPAVFYGAWPILRLAGRGLLQGIVRAETLQALGILCAWGYSAVEAIRHGPHVYFDTACAIVTLVLLGKWIEKGARERAMKAVTRLYSLLPTKARVVAGDRERFVAIEALRPGDLLLVKAGERFPADGIVEEGESHVDESMLTGESAPVPKKPGDPVVGGSINASGVLRVRASRVASESTLARVVAMVERALAARSSVERMADRVTRVFVPVVMTIAAGAGVGWAWSGRLGVEEAVMRAVTVLVIACPCALGIAAPLAVTVGIGAASRRGILVRDSRVLETLERVDVLVLDKTGTVTTDVVSLIEVDERHLAELASLELCSEHPIGRAVVARARERGLVLVPAADVTIHGGQGLSGTVAGRRLAIGVPGLVGLVDPELEARARAHERNGATVAFYGRDGEARGLLALGSTIRPGAAELVSEVRARGIKTIVLSGDSLAATEWAAGRIGAEEFRHGVRPEEKAACIEELRSRGRVVAMVGDGVNDAPALAAADLGIAMGSGTDIAMSAAAVTLTCNQLPRVLDVFRIARRTLGIVRQNLFWAFFYNSAGVFLALTGRLNPIVGAAAMVASSLCVIANSARLAGEGGEKARPAGD